YAYVPSVTGGVWVAAGDPGWRCGGAVLTGAGPGGGPHVKVLDGATGAVEQSFYAGDSGATGGVQVAAARWGGGAIAAAVAGADPWLCLYAGATPAPGAEGAGRAPTGSRLA